MTHDDRLAPDPRLASLLRAAEGGPSAPEPAWDELHAAVMRRAELPLARRRAALRAAGAGRSRAEPEWWELAAGWARAAVPLALAASAALILSIAATRETAVAATPATPTVRSAVEEVLVAAAPDDELLHALIGSSDNTWAVRGAYDRE